MKQRNKTGKEQIFYGTGLIMTVKADEIVEYKTLLPGFEKVDESTVAAGKTTDQKNDSVSAQNKDESVPSSTVTTTRALRGRTTDTK